MDLIPVLNEIEALFMDCFTQNGINKIDNMNEFKVKSSKILSKLEDPNAIINVIQMLFLKKVDPASKHMFELYNSLLMETLTKKLVKKPKHLDVFFDKNEDVYKLLFTAKKEILITCVYRDPSKSLLNCLFELILKGIKVKLILNPHSEKTYKKIMEGTGVLWRIHQSLSHDFTIIDRKVLILDIVEETIVIENESLGKKFEDQFTKLWETEFVESIEPTIESPSTNFVQTNNDISLQSNFNDSKEESSEDEVVKPKINGIQNKSIKKKTKPSFSTKIKSGLNKAFNIGLFSTVVTSAAILYQKNQPLIHSTISKYFNS